MFRLPLLLALTISVAGCGQHQPTYLEAAQLYQAERAELEILTKARQDEQDHFNAMADKARNDYAKGVRLRSDTEPTYNAEIEASLAKARDEMSKRVVAIDAQIEKQLARVKRARDAKDAAEAAGR